MSFKLEIVSPARKVFEGEVKSVSIPGTLGNFQVLKNHAPMISTFAVGKIKIENHTGTIEYSTSGGVFEVKNNKAIVLAESIESKEEINIERAKHSKIRAEELLKSSELSSQEKEDAKFALQRAINRLKFTEKN
ncbi:MAG: ATP synthase F1 subunit epsilon [Ignavibacteria bacterium]|nr:ATP synthase F1 subunit epsilon [Ignavibacteria bacterium]